MLQALWARGLCCCFSALLVVEQTQPQTVGQQIDLAVFQQLLNFSIIKFLIAKFFSHQILILVFFSYFVKICIKIIIKYSVNKDIKYNNIQSQKRVLRLVDVPGYAVNFSKYLESNLEIHFKLVTVSLSFCWCSQDSSSREICMEKKSRQTFQGRLSPPTTDKELHWTPTPVL